MAGAASRLFGGGFGEMPIASVIGRIVAFLTRFTRMTRAQRLDDALAALVAALVASSGSTWLVNASPTVAVLGGLLLLIPGYAFAVALDELATRHLVAGTSRFMGAFTVILFLGLGVLRAGKLAATFPNRPLISVLPVVPFWVDATSIGFGLFCLGIWFR